MMTRRLKKSSKQSPPSFSSLPRDIVLNIVARISLTHRSTLSLVSNTFKTLVASPDLYATRSLIGKTESCIYVCLDLNKDNPNPNPRWFTLTPTPERQKLIPIPYFPLNYRNATVVSTGSEIYVIGGHARRRKKGSSKSVFLLDCRSHQWSRLENMRVGRQSPAAEVIDGKMYVIGGCTSKQDKDWGEVYDPKTQIWEPLLPTMLDLTTRKSVFPGKLVMGGKIYVISDELRLYVKSYCFVEMGKDVFCLLLVSLGSLLWLNAKGNKWSTVMGLGEFPYISNNNYRIWMHGEKRVTIWWKKHRDVWCAEILFERRGFEELWGFVQWSKRVFDDGHGSDSDFFLHSALVTH